MASVAKYAALSALSAGLIGKCVVDFYHHRDSVPAADLSASTSLSVVVGMTIFYLVAVFGGKAWMQNREPFEAKEAMVVYNVSQALFNTWWVATCLMEVYRLGLSPWTAVADWSKHGGLAYLIWAHYFNKYFEFFDTFFMVIRKKNNQISFLHVYHHSVMSPIWFTVMKVQPVGESYFGALANSFIHVLMYSYYGMALLKLPCPWKKSLTTGQLIQFVVCFAHAWWVAFSGRAPFWLCMVQVWCMSSMFILFMNFYKKSYSAKKGGVKEE